MSAVTSTHNVISSLATDRNADAKTAGVDPQKKLVLQRKREEAEKVAQEFETMFIDMMVKSMRQTAQREDVSNAEDIYQGMLDSEYSKSMTAGQSFGIRTQILDWLEQTDPQLQASANNKEFSNEESRRRPDVSLDSNGLLSESMALRAATQAYRLASPSR